MAEVTGRETAGGQIVLGQNNYGKSEIRPVKVKRDTDRHEVWDLDVAVALRATSRLPTCTETTPNCWRQTPCATRSTLSPRTTSSGASRTSGWCWWITSS